mmetsp:Transcript_18831/g.39389  ORF Transcript_18831/g.39389 Transcript_18831/m.39389 type:complete len:81 (+) Transcript_18831:109-351(+)
MMSLQNIQLDKSSVLTNISPASLPKAETTTTMNTVSMEYCLSLTGATLDMRESVELSRYTILMKTIPKLVMYCGTPTTSS